MTGADGFLAAAGEALTRLREQRDELRRAAGLVADALAADRRVVAFGSGHSHAIAEELYGRAGGLRGVEAVLDPALMLHLGAARASAIEKLPGYGRLLVEDADIGGGDVVIVISNSGRNAVPVEFAETARERGAHVIAITSLAHTSAFASRAPSGRRLLEVADVVLDNGAPVGDATVALSGRDERVGALSTLTGAAVAQSLIAEAAQRLVESGRDPDVIVSFNVDVRDRARA